MKPKSHHSHYGKKRGLHLLALGAITVCLSGAAASAAEVTYRYYRFNPTALPAGTNAPQLSEITMSLRGQKLNLNNSTGVGPVVNVNVTGGTNAADHFEGAMKVVDGDPGTKWLSQNLQPIQFTFDAPVTIDSYNFATANDFKDRTPIRWTFEGSNDGEAWVTLDNRTGGDNIAIYGRSHFTYQNGYPVARSSQVVLSNLYAIPAIVAPGTPVTVNYATTNAPTSVTVEPGAHVGSPTTTTFTPTASGVHTLTAVNGSGTTTGRFNIKVVTPQTVNYRYIRYTPTRLRDASAQNSTQLAEFEFYNGATKVPVQSVTNPGGRNPAGEPPERLIDGIVNVAGNKYLDFTKFSPVVFDFGSAQTLTGYQFYTGGDGTGRQPLRWTIEGSDDGTTWTMLEKLDADYPTDPGNLKPSGILPFSYVPPTIGYDLTWTGASNLWDHTTPNFTGTQTTFSDGLSVQFDDTAPLKNVIAAGQLVPKYVSVNNSAGNDYTFGGGIVNGTDTFSKTGAGKIFISSPTAVTGAMSFDGGGLLVASSRALGDPQADPALAVDGGTLIEVNESQYLHRALNIGNATINVAEGKTFASVGRKRLTGTLTKTGPGTMSFYAYNNSFTSENQNLIVEQGVVLMGNDAGSGGTAVNSLTFGANRLRATVKNGGILRTSYSGAFGGDADDFYPGIGQLRIEEGGRLELNGSRNYLPAGLVTTGGVAQGRIVLKGATLVTAGQMESVRGASAELNTRSVLTVEESDTTSVIEGGGLLTNNVNMWVLDVANGSAEADLRIVTRVEGNGFIKNGPGNLELTSNNTYTGFANYNPETSPAWASAYGAVINGGSFTLANAPADANSSAIGTTAAFIAPSATLRGSGQMTGSVRAEGTIAPGTVLAPTANLRVGSTVLTGTLAIPVDGEDRENTFGDFVSGNGRLTVNGNLNITGATLAINSFGAGVTGDRYVIVKYTGDLTGTFSASPSLPSGFEIVYDTAAKEIRIEGEGIEPAGYAGWIAGTDLTGEEAEASSDPDGDGLPNLIEFIVGGNPEVSNLENAPTMSRDAVTGDFIFVYGRTSESAYLNPFVEYSTSLAADDWTQVPSGNVSVEPNGISAGVDKITVTLPASLADGGKLFARLKASL